MIGRRAWAGLILGLAPCVAGAQTVYVASQSAGTLVALAPGSKSGSAPLTVGRGPAQMAAGPNGQLYLTHPDTGQVTLVDEPGGSLRRTYPVPGQPFGIAISADGAQLYVGDWAGNRVMRLSAESGRLEGTVPVGREPAALVIDGRGTLYVADRESRQVSVVDTTAMARVATIPVGEAPFALTLSPAGDRLYVANVRGGTVSVIDTANRQTVATFAVGGMPYGVAVSPDGARILVTDQRAGTLVVVDTASGATVAAVPVGRYPEGVAVAGPRAYVANWFSDSVSVIDLTTLRETHRIAVPEGPRSLVVPPGAAR